MLFRSYRRIAEYASIQNAARLALDKWEASRGVVGGVDLMFDAPLFSQPTYSQKNGILELDRLGLEFQSLAMFLRPGSLLPDVQPLATMGGIGAVEEADTN